MNQHVQQTDLTLLDQLRITEFDIASRKQMLEFTGDEENLLSACREHIEHDVEALVAEFYDGLLQFDEVQLTISDSDTLRRLHNVQRQYVLDLFSGCYDIEYVNNRLRVGLVHHRISLEPRLYLGAVQTLKHILYRWLATWMGDVELRHNTELALDRLLYFDLTLMFDTYMRGYRTEIELSQDRAESYAKSLEAKIAQRTQQLKELSTRDDLTGLFNRRALFEYLRRDIGQARRQMHPLALVYLDVDHFKEINDEFGHQRGDEVLKAVADAMRESCREVDVPCRYGGDEFCLVLPGSTADGAATVSARLIAAFTKREPDMEMSIGIAELDPEAPTDAETLIRQADTKMYEAKTAEQAGSQIRL